MPKILSTSPTYLPPLDKAIFYYVVHSAFNALGESSFDSVLEIDINELVKIIDSSNLDTTDTRSLVVECVNRLTSIKISLVDGGFHMKVCPVSSVYLYGAVGYIGLDPVIVGYLDQVFDGNYAVYDMICNSIV
ncbi:MAG: hypothetical protein ACRDA3_09305 [Peptostreptococcaceae bacterium]